ncbi:hypothetical protein V496_08178 [Pseudogymnoascus sp. VKM F-4515 (FW-2607)]|nr:hypothetical protein V496_08178 [Pseudogymnoascus sp. VKM F-4515 (FW-2607)]
MNSPSSPTTATTFTLLPDKHRKTIPTYLPTPTTTARTMAPPGRTSPSPAVSPRTQSNSDTAPANPGSPSNNTATSQDAPPSPRPGSGSAASTSLQATAAMNAGLAQEDSRRSSISSSRHRSRRRSTVLMNLAHNNPSVPAPGEMVHEPHTQTGLDASPRLGAAGGAGVGDPHHLRNPSLGEIHQELENEQEAQVNRLLQMIRIQQQQLQSLRASSGLSPTTSAIDDSVPSDPTTATGTTASSAIATPLPIPRSPSSSTTGTGVGQHPRSSFDLARADLQRRERSRTPSRHASPRLGSTAGLIGEEGLGRDESAFYQAETQMLVRENQMLRLRIRELERQGSDTHANSSMTREPSLPSNLLVERSESDVTPRPAEEKTA